MPKSKKAAAFPKIPLLIAALVLIVIGLLIIKSYKLKKLPQTGPTASPAVITAQAVFQCDDKKSINAMFEGDQVKLVLSDGREMTLPQAMSASGARYANSDESFVFWNKGDTAFIQEGQKTSFADCVVVKPSEEPKNTVSVKGEIICLPHKNQAGPQTMECAYGLKAENGTYYGLRDSDPSYKNISGVPMNKQVEVTGSIKLGDDQKYNTVGTLTIQKLKQI